MLCLLVKTFTVAYGAGLHNCNYSVLSYICVMLTMSCALENRNAYVFHNVGSTPHQE